MKRSVKIVGIGESAYHRYGGSPDTEFGLLRTAIKNAAADAGIDVAAIDGFFSYATERHEPVDVMRSLGIPTIRASAITWGGSGGGAYGSFQYAAAALLAGDCDVAIVYRSLAQGEFFRYGTIEPWADRSYNLPYGLLAPVQVLSLQVQRYLSRYSVPLEALGHVAVQANRHAQTNPLAISRGRTFTLEDHQNSRMIATPHRLFDCCLESDGATAVILTRDDRAADTRKPVTLAAASHTGETGWNQGSFGYHNQPAETYGTGNIKSAAELVYRRAGVGPADIGSAQVFTAFSGLALMGLEDLGFAEPGGAAELVMSGETLWPAGRIPMSTAGGSLGEAYIHGLNLVNEAVRQVREEAHAQVANSDFSIATVPAGANPSSVMLVGK